MSQVMTHSISLFDFITSYHTDFKTAIKKILTIIPRVRIVPHLSVTPEILEIGHGG